MRKYIAAVLTLGCMLGFVACEQKDELQQGDYAMRYFFAAKVIEVNKAYLLLEVLDSGNSNLLEGSAVEVSTDVVSADGCPAFAADEYATVLMEQNVKDSSKRLEAFSIYKTDETGKSIAD